MTEDAIDRIFQEERGQYPGSRKPLPDLAYVPREEVPDDIWRDDFTVKTVRGRDVRLYSIGALASALQVSVAAVRKWMIKGIIPDAPYRLPSTMVIRGEKAPGRRLYTEELIDAAVDVFRSHGILGAPRIEWHRHPDVPIEIVEAWQRIVKEEDLGPK